MARGKFDRNALLFKSLSERESKVLIERDHIPIDTPEKNFSDNDREHIARCSEKIRDARKKKASVVLAFGAHTIKNGMTPTLEALIREGWVTHLATNGAGIIHDWEFAYQGKSSENVRENVKLGQFGIWEETGYFINLALIVGAFEGLGYGESVWKMIFQEGLNIPETAQLYALSDALKEADPELSAAAIDLAGVIKSYNLSSGFLSIPHPYKEFSIQSVAYSLGIRFTGHPMIGYDIIYTHPMNHGAAVGRTSQSDFLYFVDSISRLNEGVYLSVGSAVMSPMIFEKALSMARNEAIQHQKQIDRHFIMVVDLARSEWGWQQLGEPPPDNPAYYLRFCKTFSRMGGEMHYLTADNRDFLLALYHALSHS
jgi:hypothetical protein